MYYTKKKANINIGTRQGKKETVYLFSLNYLFADQNGNMGKLRKLRNWKTRNKFYNFL